MEAHTVAPSGRVTVTTASNGSGLTFVDWQHRADADVIGWERVCEYRWRGDHCLRASATDSVEIEARRVYSLDAYEPTEVQEGRQCSGHARPLAILAFIEASSAEVRGATEKLNASVAAASGAGAIWEAIGRSAGMKRQAAHARWS